MSGRRGSVPFYMMLEPEQMDRYHALRDAAGHASMKALIVTALDFYEANRDSDRVEKALADTDALRDAYRELAQRISSLEKRMP